MTTAKIAITIEQSLLTHIDQLVDQKVYPNRSKAIQAAIQEKLERMSHNRLARECALLNPTEEQTLAEEGIEFELFSWSEY